MYDVPTYHMYSYKMNFTTIVIVANEKVQYHKQYKKSIYNL